VSAGWEQRAEQWLAWARTPGFDAYWAYRDAFDALVPPPAGRCSDRAGASARTSCTRSPTPGAGRTPGDDDSPFVVDGSYLGARRFAITIERGALRMRLDGMAYPLEDYASALKAAGLVIEALREPVPDDEHVAAFPAVERWRSTPMFLQVRALRPI
jgi:hypothetical protein